MIRSTSKHIDKCLEIIQCCIIIFMQPWDMALIG